MERLTENQKELVSQNYKLAFFGVRQFQKQTNSTVDESELISDAMYSLVRAAIKFNPNFGVKFNTYAMSAILQNLRKVTSNPVHIPEYIRDNIKKYRYWRNSNLNLSIDDFMKTLTITKGTVKIIKEGIEKYSQDDVFWSGAFIDVVADNEFNEFDSQEAIASLTEKLKNLDEREQLVIRMRFYERESLDKVGKVLGVTKERARQLQLRAIEKLKKMYGVAA